MCLDLQYIFPSPRKLLLSQSWHDHATSSTLQCGVSGTPPSTDSTGCTGTLPVKEFIRVPGCSWKATAQETPTISLGTFSIQFTAQVALGSFIPILPGTGHFWLPTLALSPGNHVQKLLSKPTLGPLRGYLAPGIPAPKYPWPRPPATFACVGTQQGRTVASPLAARALSPAHQQLHLAAKPPSPPPERRPGLGRHTR